MSVQLNGADMKMLQAKVVKSGGVSLLLQVSNHHGGSALLSEAVCATLATLALRNPDHCNLIVAEGGPEIVLQCMKNHKTHSGLQVCQISKYM